MPELIPNQSLGGIFAQNLGSGLGSGLENLIQHKLNEVQGVKLWKSFGLDDQTARSFASAPVELQKSLLDRLEGSSIGYQSHQGQIEQPMQQDQQQIGQQQVPSQMQQQQLNQLVQPIQQPEQQLGGFKLGPTKEERRHKEILNEQKLARQSKENSSAFKETAAYRTQLNDKAEAAEGNLFRIKEARALEKEGKLNSQAYLSFLNASGLENVEGLINGDTSAYNKILADFQKGAKEIYGGRISNAELEQFLKTIPTLNMSPSGRSKIFNMMEYWNRGDIEKQKLAQEIRKENGGVPPLDLQEQVIERSKSRLDKLAEKFKDNLKNALELAQRQQGSSKASVAASHGLGKLIKNLPRALTGAVGGAYLGSRVGPAGIIPGAAAGGLAGLSGLGVKDLL